MFLLICYSTTRNELFFPSARKACASVSNISLYSAFVSYSRVVQVTIAIYKDCTDNADQFWLPRICRRVMRSRRPSLLLENTYCAQEALLLFWRCLDWVAYQYDVPYFWSFWSYKSMCQGHDLFPRFPDVLIRKTLSFIVETQANEIAMFT